MFDILLDYEIALCNEEFTFTSGFAGKALRKIAFSITLLFCMMWVLVIGEFYFHEVHYSLATYK